MLLTGSLVSAQVLNSAESVEYDPVNGRFLASNGSSVIIVDGNGDEVDFFGADPEADYGMEVMNGVLFTIVGGNVMGYDANTGDEVLSVTISGANFLNGMASDGDHRLWVTDFGAKTIHEIDVTDLNNPVPTMVVDNTVSTPNGIVYDATMNRLVFVNWSGSSKIKAVNLDTYEVTTLLTTELGNCDGIDNDNDGNFFVSSWTPTRITKFSNEFTTDEIITVPGLSSPADICYAEEIDTLAIPNSGNNTIVYVGFGTVSDIISSENEAFAFDFSPNPVSQQTAITFYLPHQAMTQLDIIDQQGRLVQQLISENLSGGQHRVLLAGIDLAPGAYCFRLNVETESVVRKFVVRS